MRLLKIRPQNNREEYFLGFGLVWGFVAATIFCTAIYSYAWWLVR